MSNQHDDLAEEILAMRCSFKAMPCLFDQLASPEQKAAGPAHDLALEQLVDQLPAPQATALRLTILEGASSCGRRQSSWR